MVKPVYLALILLLWAAGCSSCLGQQIKDRYTYATSPQEVLDIFFSDANYGWMIVADHNRNEDYLLRTRNGGSTWTQVKAPKGLSKLHFIDPQIGWSLQRVPESNQKTATFLLATKTGGNSWTRLSAIGQEETLLDGLAVTSLAFSDAQHGWFCGVGPYNSGIALETSDGGRTTHKIPDVSAEFGAPLGIFVRRNVTWIFGMGFFLRSTDLGRTWSVLDLSQLHTSTDLFSIRSGFFWEDGRGWTAGMVENGAVLGTRDFGRQWQVELTTGPRLLPDSVSSWDHNHVCAVAHPNALFCTSDGGSTWSRRDTLPRPTEEQANFFAKLVILKSGRGWALRGGGFLYETSDGGGSWHLFDSLHSFTN